MQNNSFLLYGANGYTGQLIAEMAHEYGLKPVLAGRNKAALAELSNKFGFDYKIVDLDDTANLIELLKQFKVVLHAAGPFQYTSAKMVNACLAAGTHYLDITGEIGVFEQTKKMDDLAKTQGIMLMPGVGFDVVPTDCVAKYLHNLMPEAIKLKLAFASLGGQLSHGTATTMAEGMGEGGAIRENGKIVKKPLGHKGMLVDFGLKKIFVMTIPWGDVSTAFFTTGIPNIEAYTMTSPKTFTLLKWQWCYNWLLRTAIVKKFLKNKIKQKPAGPDANKRAKAKSLVWGEVENTEGKKISIRLVCPEGYTLTAISSLMITKKVLDGQFKIGYQTPAACYGADLVLEISGVTRS
jgi:short subunit dehydrogenase-like uncharacterized protein